MDSRRHRAFAATQARQLFQCFGSIHHGAPRSKFLHPCSNEAHGQSFDRERLSLQVDLYRAISRIGWLETDSMSFAPEVFDRGFIVDACDDDLAVARFARAMHGEQIA